VIDHNFLTSFRAYETVVGDYEIIKNSCVTNMQCDIGVSMY